MPYVTQLKVTVPVDHKFPSQARIRYRGRDYHIAGVVLNDEDEPMYEMYGGSHLKVALVDQHGRLKPEPPKLDGWVAVYEGINQIVMFSILFHSRDEAYGFGEETEGFQGVIQIDADGYWNYT